VAATLADLAAAFGADRPAAVCRELTKVYEEVRRAPLGELAGWASGAPVRGEITLVVGGAPATAAERPADGRLRAAVAALEAGGTSRRDAISAVAREHGLRKREVYALVVSSSGGASSGGASPGGASSGGVSSGGASPGGASPGGGEEAEGD
jgi:16S rRNA (cytidine1402-2'-O)-methyltransferase